jgi:hypothetical protein
LGTRVDVFCYPSGRYDTQVEALLAEDGYVAGLSTQPGTVHSITDLDALTRVRIHGSDTLRGFGLRVGVKLPVMPTKLTTIRTKGAVSMCCTELAPWWTRESGPDY